MVFLISDSVLCVLCLLLSVFLRFGYLSLEMLTGMLPVFVFVGVIGPLLLWLMGFYRTLIRAFDFRSVNLLGIGCLLTGVFLAAFAYFYGEFLLPRSTPIIYVIVSFLFLGSSRVLARWLYVYSQGVSKRRVPVLIFGAGEAGNKIASILSGSTEFSVVAFLDDDISLQGNYMRGRKVYAPDQITELVRRYGDLRVLLGIKSLTPERKRDIYERLNTPGVRIDVVPSLTDVVVGRASINDFRELQIEDLLGREIVSPIPSVFDEALSGAVVMVTGGGGSIGSEICQQIIVNKPAKLILLEQSEFALYRVGQQINQTLAETNSGISIEYCLGRAEDRELVSALLNEHHPDLVIHTAAYKHVPMVENNIIEAVKNNIFSTKVLAEECAKHKVGRFLLISTDKAVRPTNIMGATKRFSELIIQAQAMRSKHTIFSMVRFGNVLGSSGSVVPLFSSQIENGGPVTVTHKDVTRYFMTIAEAAQLVVQAAFIAKGGEVFVLDMGELVKIDTLARLAIRLSGYTVRDEQNPEGDIEIKYIGLRPGEKLFEELLVDGTAVATIHPKILKANEPSLSKKELDQHVSNLMTAVQARDQKMAATVLQRSVPEFVMDKNHVLNV